MNVENIAMYNDEILRFKESIGEAFLELKVLNPEKIETQIGAMIGLIDKCSINIAYSTELLSMEVANILEASTPNTIRNDKLDDLAIVLKKHLGPILPLFQSKILDNIDSFAKYKLKNDFFKDDFTKLRIALKGIQGTIEVFYRKFDMYGAIWKMKII